MRKFLPVKPHHRVTLAVGGNLIVVEKSGLSLPTHEKQTLNVYDPATGDYKPEEQDVPINGDVFAALEAHPFVTEVAHAEPSKDKE